MMRAINVSNRLIRAVMLAGIFGVYGGPLAAQDDAEDRKPRTQVTEKLSPAVYQKIFEAQEALSAQDHAKAERILLALKDASDSYNDYELSQIYNFLAAVHYEQGNTAATIADYIAILKLQNPPQQLRDNALFRLAQLYFIEEDYARSIKLLDQWMKQVDSVRPEAYMLKAQAHYQLEQFAEAKGPILQAMREAGRRKQPPAENWFGLLRAVYYELGDYPNAVKVLAQMVKRWPKPSYYKQLSGMLGLMDQQRAQLYVMHAAATAGMLDSEFEVLNLARLYMAEDAPFAAVELLEQGLDAGLVEETAANLQLLAQAMSLARDPEGQIPVLEKAAAMSRDARDYMYLGQAQLALYRWADAVVSFEQALKLGDLDRPGSVRMQLGTAYFNLKRYSRARQAFAEARAYEEHREQAGQWVRFIDAEVAREQALKAGT